MNVVLNVEGLVVVGLIIGSGVICFACGVAVGLIRNRQKHRGEIAKLSLATARLRSEVAALQLEALGRDVKRDPQCPPGLVYFTYGGIGKDGGL